jgi:hypothetical protein
LVDEVNISIIRVFILILNHFLIDFIHLIIELSNFPERLLVIRWSSIIVVVIISEVFGNGHQIKDWILMELLDLLLYIIFICY